MWHFAKWIAILGLLCGIGFSDYPAYATNLPIDESNFTQLHSNSGQVIPGGQSIGIKLRSAGVLVVGYHFIHSGRELFSPGERANIHIGDLITKVSGKSVARVEVVAQQIEDSGTHGKLLTLEFKRKGQVLFTRIKPQWDEDSGVYRIGLYIRDSAAGVGTLTFFDPSTHTFAALGHVVTDADTGQAIDGHGEIVRAAVTSIDRGESGQPGEKRGTFVDEKRILGKVFQNNAFGVFGTLSSTPSPSLINTPMQIALPDMVKPCAAKILTVIHDQKVEAFDAMIIKVNTQHTAGIKSFIIQVTDPRLLKATGGIVQGMSGSPVIADHKLIGAITHVFLSDPTRGYGIFAAWMQEKTQSIRPAA